jgi:TolB-like protein/Tfp pilus assembly protein PilF
VEPPKSLSKVYRFGAYEADTHARELRKRGVRIRLRLKAFEVLASLLERPGEVITREELRVRLWPAARFLEFDNSINSAVHRLRDALADPAHKSEFIETLPRVGYRFVARVEAAVSGARPSAARLVVLPIENLSGDPEQEYFSDGLTEELITQLAGFAPERLRVIARTSAMHYRKTRKDTAQIGRELNVDYVVEGSVRRAADRVRISAQLIQVSDQTHLWANSYDGELRDILKLQREVAEAIAARIESSLAGPVRPRAVPRTVNPEAHDHYLKGLYYFNKFNPEALNRAAEYFESAAAKDPSYVEAHAQLARTRGQLAFWGWAARGTLMRKSEEGALAALRLDENSAEAHGALAFVRWYYDWDWPNAEQEFERAAMLAPNDSVRHWGLVAFLGSIEEDHERSIAEIEFGLEVDPLSVMLRLQAGWAHYWARMPDRAIEMGRNAIEMDPGSITAYWIIGLSLLAKSSFEEAIGTFGEAKARFGDSYSLGALGMAYGLAGQREKAREVLAELERRSSNQWVSEIYFAWVHIGLGDYEKALDWMERAYQEHNPHLLFAHVAPAYDPLRAEPRYQKLMAQLKLPYTDSSWQPVAAAGPS